MIKKILLELQETNAHISVEEGRLVIDAAKGAIKDHLRALIKGNKMELVNYIVSVRGSGFESIPVAEDLPDHPVSYSQHRLWLIDQIGIDKASYNMCGSYQFREAVDPELFRLVVTRLVERHEVLRTVFIEREGMPRQKLVDIRGRDLEIQWIDVPQGEDARSLCDLMRQEQLHRIFKLDEWPLFTFCFIRDGADRTLLYSMHHIISDGWSMELLLRDTLALYRAELAGVPSVLPALPIQYKDYSVWQTELLAKGGMDSQEQYWRSQLGGTLEELRLPYDQDPSAGRSNEAAFFDIYIDPDLKKKVDLYLTGHKISLFAFLIACFKILLNRLTGQTDIIIGTPVANRDHDETKDLIGFFLNTLMLRDQVNTGSDFDNFLLQVNKTLLNALENQSYPFEKLLELLAIKRNFHQFPISSVFLNMLSFSDPGQHKLQGAMSAHRGEKVLAKFDLECYFQEYSDVVAIKCEYRTCLFSPNTIEYWMKEFVLLVGQVVQRPFARLDELTIFETGLPKSAGGQISRPFVFFEREEIEQSVVSRFEEQVGKYGDATAICQDGRRTSYRELNALTNGLAMAITASGGGRGSNIALLLTHGREAVTGMLGVLKSGNAYMPLDPSYPLERLLYMMENAWCVSVVACSATIRLAEKIAGERQGTAIIDLETIVPLSVNPVIRIDPMDKAYVLYTSGSTGKPKGVVQLHRNVLHFTRVYTNNLHINADDRVSLLPKYGFDASVSDIYSALLNGAALYPYSLEREGTDGLSLWLLQTGVTVLHMVPTVYRYFMKGLKGDRFSNLRLVVLGGEAVYREDFQQFRAHCSADACFINTYGPTESSTVLQHLLCAGSDWFSSAIPLGSAVADTEVCLWNVEGQEVGIYQQGEIVYKSDFLSPGYLNKPAQGRVYRSGDIGRRLPSGEIEFIGRKDNQIKLNGHRIELLEIEQQLLAIEGLHTAAVVVKGKGAAAQLVAYIGSDKELTGSVIRQRLQQVLPLYMQPGVYVFPDVFPMTASGKIDKLSLPDPPVADLSAYVHPRDNREKRLTAIWQELLGIERIGIRDDFFALGGHSLLATRLAGRIRKEFAVGMQLKELFTLKTPEEQAAWIGQAKRKEFTDIPSAATAPDYPLSSSQRRLWILNQLEERREAYNMPGIYILDGSVDPTVLRRSLSALLERHEILRTVFRQDEQGEIRQRILAAGDTGFDLFTQDLRQDEKRQEILPGLLEEILNASFDLSAAPLWRVGLYRMSDNKWVLAYVFHHIISDGLSMDLLISELFQLYNAYGKREQDLRTPLPIQYKDYAVWQQEQLAGDGMRIHKEYWLERFSGALPVQELSTDKPRPAIRSYRGGVLQVDLDKDLYAAIKAYCQEMDVTLYMALLAAVHVLLYRYTGQGDIITGCAVAGRDHPDLENQAGCYINTLALRCQLTGKKSYRDVVQDIRQVTLASYDHQAYPFDELAGELDHQSDMSRNALFDVMVSLQSRATYHEDLPGAAGIKISRYDGIARSVSKFDCSFSFTERADGLELNLEYNSDIFERATIGRMSAHYSRLLGKMVAEPDAPVDCVDFLGEKERGQLLDEFNDTRSFFPADESIVDLMDKQEHQCPDQPAIVFGHTELTYRELFIRAGRLSGYLQETYQLQKDDLVGIRLERSEWLVIAILGVLRCGAAYVPIDPSYPKERMDYIMADSKCKVIIDASELVKMQQGAETYPDAGTKKKIRGEDLAYCIYTSGSTGQPKGCLVTHRNVVNFFTGMDQVFGREPGMMLSLTNYTFDISVLELLWTLTLGYTIMLVKDPESLIGTERYPITHLQLTPSVATILKSALPAFRTIKKLLVGGEKLLPDLVHELHHALPDAEIYNMYGPTETTIWSACIRIDRGTEKILIGKPIANTTIYILDGGGGLLPIGVEGEIFIGGEGVAREYLNKPALTAERFIADPFNGRRMYRTGDHGKWLADGNIEYAGRKDDQVKIQGHRIEIGEVEVALRSNPMIASCVVVDREGAEGEKDLVAYVVVSEEIQTDEELHVGDLRGWLAGKLPRYCIPADFIQLPSLPLTPSGKIDKKQLSLLQGRSLGTKMEYIAPVSDADKKLALIWKALLQRERISMHDNFFELGGNSLKISRLAARIRQVFGVTVEFRELYRNSTLEQQGALLAGAKKMVFYAIPLAAQAEHYPLSAAQRRLWLLSQLEEGSVAYHISGVYQLEGILHIEALQYSFDRLRGRHESLRTRFGPNEQGEISQFIRPLSGSEYGTTIRDLSGERYTEDECRSLVQAELAVPFDLVDDDLLRVSFYRLSGDRWMLLFVIHHLISDGWSLGILVKELLQIYAAHIKGKADNLPALRIQYKDFSAWQEEQLQASRMEEHAAYWLDMLKGDLPVSDLPTDMSRPFLMTHRGGLVRKLLDPVLTRKLEDWCRGLDATMFMGVLSAVYALLYRYTGKEDMIIGTPVAGRDHADLEDQIGCFVNTLALRAMVDGDRGFESLLNQVRQLALDAYEHQSYPFDELVGKLDLPRDMSRNVLFDVMVVMQNNERVQLRNRSIGGELTITPVDNLDLPASKFDLLFSLQQTDAGLDLTIEYNRDLFYGQTITRMADHLGQILLVALQEPSRPIRHLDYLTKAEQKEILGTFNDTEIRYPDTRMTVLDLFGAQVDRTPASTALVFEALSFTYREVDQITNQLARYIRERTGVRQGECIGVLTSRTQWAAFSMIAVMKLGCVYVPVDRGLPAGRIRYMLQSCNCRALVVNTSDGLPADSPPVADLRWFTAEADASEIGIVPDGGDTSYIIYTSGSTGDPKGVEQTHLMLFNLVMWDMDGAKMDRPTRHLQFSSFSFDSSLHDIYYALCTGGEIHIISEPTRMDWWTLNDYIVTKEITTLSMPYAALRSFFGEIGAEEFSGHRIREIISTGEQLYVSGGLRAFLKRHPHIRIYNLYGPSETHVVTGSVFSFAEGDIPERPCIGRPVYNTYLYILDDAMQPVPVGVEGELYIGGWNLAKGYHGSPELTAAKFIASPFREGERLYRSGDLVKWLPEGAIEYRMRKDGQVKVNGYRIEPGEIEAMLKHYTGIEDALVKATNTAAGDQELLAFIVSRTVLDIGSLRNYLKSCLPAYLIPQQYIQLDAFPLTLNGKIDWKSMPATGKAISVVRRPYLPPTNDTEDRLAEIWAAVLALEKGRIGIQDNFFDLGGHSLKAMRLIAWIKREFSIEIKIRDFFSEPTIEATASGLNTLIWMKNGENAGMTSTDKESLVF